MNGNSQSCFIWTHPNTVTINKWDFIWKSGKDKCETTQRSNLQQPLPLLQTALCSLAVSHLACIYTQVNGSVAVCIVLLWCFCSLLHWRSSCEQFFIWAEIHFGCLPLSLSLSASVWRKRMINQINLTFPFVCGGKEVRRKEVRIKTLFLLKSDSDTSYYCTFICDPHNKVLWKSLDCLVN